MVPNTPNSRARWVPTGLWLLPRLVVLTVLVALACGPVQGQTDESTGGLKFGAITIDPAQPSADTLCKLMIEVRNTGTETASAFDLRVLINGKSVKVYETQLLYEPIAAGETRVLRLHNFWTTETNRPAVDGKLEIEITLEGAKWMKIENKTEEGRQVEEWTPSGDVPGLPVSVRLSQKLG